MKRMRAVIIFVGVCVVLGTIVVALASYDCGQRKSRSGYSVSRPNSSWSEDSFEWLSMGIQDGQIEKLRTTRFYDSEDPPQGVPLS